LIVRILGEGQYELPDAESQRLNDLDRQAVAAVEGDDEDTFSKLWDQMLRLVEDNGTRLSNEELMGSDVLLPPRDVRFDEAKRDFTGEGLVPDLQR
jgi:hypothetical protein